MQVGFFNPVSYAGTPMAPVWPTPPVLCDREAVNVTMRRAREQLCLADELGFDWVSVSEHHYSPRILAPSPMIYAGAMTEVVKRAKIAVLGPLLPLSNPVRVAEELAMLDAMSNGRIMVLFLRGTANEILTYRSNPDEGRAVTQEGIDLILHAWTEPQPFGWEGRYFNYRTVSVWPRTIQDPHPPVFSSGNSPESVEFCASRRLNLALSFILLPDIKQRVEQYNVEAAREGWAPTADNVLYRFFAHVAENDEAAVRNTSRFKIHMGLARHMSEAVTKSLRESPPEKLEFDRPFLCGGPATVIEQVGALRAAGVGMIDISFLWPGLSYEQQLESMERFARDVLPHIRDL
ncbi:MAG: LLM class flavin-dependent oxidoreductase [Deltaproteobacteria bacterium]|nr:LLM class flavin-dependent oxidoreductase [Deltaproteobacteria bacterium]